MGYRHVSNNTVHCVIRVHSVAFFHRPLRPTLLAASHRRYSLDSSPSSAILWCILHRHTSPSSSIKPSGSSLSLSMWWTSSPSVVALPWSRHTSHIQCASSLTCRLFLFQRDVNLSLSAPVLSYLYAGFFLGHGSSYGCIFPHLLHDLYAPMPSPPLYASGPRADGSRVVCCS